MPMMPDQEYSTPGALPSSSPSELHPPSGNNRAKASTPFRVVWSFGRESSTVLLIERCTSGGMFGQPRDVPRIIDPSGREALKR